MRIIITAVLLVVVSLVTACAGGTDERERTSSKVELMALPQKHLAECHRLSALDPACPKSVPSVEATQARSRAFTSGRGHFVYFAEWSAPYPGVSIKNAPPRFAHVVVHAGDLQDAFPFQWPTEEEPVPDPIPKKRRDPALLEKVTWSGKEGELVLAPSFQAGGIDGDHVVFRWRDGDEHYAISLHGWTPLHETIQALRAVVSTIGPSQ